MTSGAEFQSILTIPHPPDTGSGDSITQGADGSIYVVDATGDEKGRETSIIYSIAPGGESALLYTLKGRDGQYGGTYAAGDGMSSGVMNGSDGRLYAMARLFWQDTLLHIDAVSKPRAVDDIAILRGGAPVTIPVLANDISAQIDPLRITGVSQPVLGMANVNGAGTVTYTPSPFFNFGQIPLSECFSYTVTDRHGRRSTAKVRVQNPFYARGGTYTGYGPLLSISLRVASNGHLKGNANYLGTNTTFAGEFDAEGEFVGYANDETGSGTAFSLRTDVSLPAGTKSPAIYCNTGYMAVIILTRSR